MLAARVDVQGRGDAAAHRPGAARGAPDVRRSRRARRAPGRRERGVQRRPARAADRGRGARGRALRHRRTPSRATRRRRASRCASSRRALQRRERRARPPPTTRCATAGSSGCSARSAPDVPTSSHTSLHAPALAARGDVHEGARDRGLPRHAHAPRLRPRRATEHQARPRRPAAEVAARLRDRERPAERRPPDHARAGRPARLPGVPPRGRPRAALRRASTRRCRTRSAASRATTR